MASPSTIFAPKTFVIRWKFPFIILILLLLGYGTKIAYKSFSEYRKIQSYANLYETASDLANSQTETYAENSQTQNDTIPQKNIIKEFDVEKLWKYNEKHIFSNDHKKSGFDNLPMSNKMFYEKIVEVVKRADSQGLLVESSNDIRTIIEGFKVTVRVYIRNGKVESINCFPNHSSRVINRLVELE